MHITATAITAAISEAIETRPFVTTWKTDNEGDTDDSSIRLPLRAGYTYNFDVDWGDGSSEVVTTDAPVDHTYGAAGTYTVTITPLGGKRGDAVEGFPTMSFAYLGDHLKIVSIEQWGNAKWENMQGAFQGCENMVFNATDAPRTQSVTNFEKAFDWCSQMTEAPAINTSNATNIGRMYNRCELLTEIRMYGSSKITDANRAFQHCHALEKIHPFDTSKVENAFSMFYQCESITQLPWFDFSKVTDATQMFMLTSALQEMPDYNFNSVVTGIGMFRESGVPELGDINLPAATDLTQFICLMPNITHTGSINVPQCTNMLYAAYGSPNLEEVTFSNSGNVEIWSTAFYLASNLNTINIDTSGGLDLSYMCYDMASLTEIPAWDFSQATDLAGFLGETTGVDTILATGISVDLSVANNNLDAVALETLFTNLADVTASPATITITGTPGAATADQTIATAKGWTVVSV